MEKEIYEKAKEKVRKKKKFQKNLANYIVTCTILFFINVFIARGYFWSLWVIFFWGLAILKEAIDIYGFPFGGEDWEEKEIRKEMERIKELNEGDSSPEFPESDKTSKKEHSPSSPDRGWSDKDLV